MARKRPGTSRRESNAAPLSVPKGEDGGREGESWKVDTVVAAAAMVFLFLFLFSPCDARMHQRALNQLIGTDNRSSATATARRPRRYMYCTVLGSK